MIQILDEMLYNKLSLRKVILNGIFRIDIFFFQSHYYTYISFSHNTVENINNIYWLK